MLRLRRQTTSSSSSLHSLHRRGRGRLRVEELETRCLLSAFTPAQIRQAYGFDQITFSSNGQTIAGDGSGQTIAIVDAYDDPNIASDLQHFDSTYGLPDPFFTKVSPTGVLPRANAGWSQEISLDVEWAHAIAPGANILLVEAASDSVNDLVNAVAYAAQQPGVAVVSMSWGGSEFADQVNFDSVFTTPAGHNGVTFVASSGDTGSDSGVSWPASSPNVLSVGGTTLHILDSSGVYGSESAWSSSTGGYSGFEAEPAWQLPLQNSGVRTTPDVSYVANPSTGLEVYDSYGVGRRSSGWFVLGGTSAGAPQWAALIAIADQGLALAGQPTLDGPSQTLPALYSLAQSSPSAYFNEITSGSNGYPALLGYNLVTGLGSPKADALVLALVTGNGGGGNSIAAASPSVVATARNASSPVAVVPKAPASTGPGSATATGPYAGSVFVLLSEHNFIATATNVSVPSSAATSGTPALTDPSVIPQFSAPHVSQVRIDSGGGDNALLPDDQGDDPQPMDGVPDYSGSGTAPRMAPAAPVAPAPLPGPDSEDQARPLPSPEDSDILFGDSGYVASLSEQTVESFLDEGSSLKPLAAAMGFWLVLAGWARRMPTQLKAAAEGVAWLEEHGKQGRGLR